MSNAKQITTMNEADYNGAVKESRGKKKKSFMDYAIWIDFPVNAAILTYIVFRIVRAFQMGIDVALSKLETGVNITGIPDLDEVLTMFLPVFAVSIAVGAVVETIYLILKLCRKKPFITERFAVIFLILKVFFVVFTAATALLFL